MNPGNTKSIPQVTGHTSWRNIGMAFSLWLATWAVFAPTCRCIAPDYLGFGLSDRPRNFSYTPQAHAANLDEFMEKLKPGPFTLIVHDYGGPIVLPFCIRRPEQVKRLVLLSTWMWSFAGNHDIEGTGRIAGSRLGRFLYGWSNLSLRVLMPDAYGDKSKLTPHIHRQYLERFPDRGSRETVLWALAKALLGSSRFYDSFWQQREKLRGRPALIVWGLKDSALKPHQLARWREVRPFARVIELDNVGHWPHEEAPDRVIYEMKNFLSHNHHSSAGNAPKTQLQWTAFAYHKKIDPGEHNQLHYWRSLRPCF